MMGLPFAEESMMIC